ncbi:hypothetical protein HAX54_031689, partial [Datura stramonium]|nr:hypothetical protein [Datura stramonium]
MAWDFYYALVVRSSSVSSMSMLYSSTGPLGEFASCSDAEPYPSVLFGLLSNLGPFSLGLEWKSNYFVSKGVCYGGLVSDGRESGDH